MSQCGRPDDSSCVSSRGSDLKLTNREQSALTEYLTVTPNIGRARDAEGMAMVTSQSGSEYLVDIRGGRCQQEDGSLCPDQQYNLEDDEDCKHVIRAKIAMGAKPVVQSTLEALDVDPQLGEHAEGPVIW